MIDFAMFLVFLISFGLVIWNVKLVDEIKNQRSHIMDLIVAKRVLMDEFMDYQRSVRKVAREHKESIFNLSDGKAI